MSSDLFLRMGKCGIDTVLTVDTRLCVRELPNVIACNLHFALFHDGISRKFSGESLGGFRV